MTLDILWNCFNRQYSFYIHFAFINVNYWYYLYKSQVSYTTLWWIVYFISLSWFYFHLLKTMHSKWMKFWLLFHLQFYKRYLNNFTKHIKYKFGNIYHIIGIVPLCYTIIICCIIHSLLMVTMIFVHGAI